jgi:alpha 1,3-glucosidase
MVLAAASLVSLSMAFKAHEFRYCKDSSFCRRQRKFDGTHAASTFKLAGVSTQPDNSLFGELTNELNEKLSLKVAFLETGIVRLTIDEPNPKQGGPRHQVQEVLVGDVAHRIVKGDLTVENGFAIYKSGPHEFRMQLAPSPFQAVLSLDGKQVLILNERNLMKWEMRRNKGDEGALEDVSGDTDDLWEESFGTHRDSKPRGPESIGMDVRFIEAKHVFGLPERAGFKLPNTKGDGAPRDEPFRLYTLDVFEYEVTQDRAHQPLYGAIPLMLAHTKHASTGLLWLNSAEMYIDVEDGEHERVGKQTHWFAESGVIDLFLMSSKSPAGVQQQYASLVGTQFMPPIFSLGYHQCRWNYKDDADVRAVDAKFDEHDIPYDVIWLDIEHTVGKRYMTWDRHLFPDPEGLQEDLASRGRKMVTIIDPHLKADMGYTVYADAKKQGLFVKDKHGNDYEGHCWPGASSWLDYLNPSVRDYWASRFLPQNYQGSSQHLYTWNDMNEPSVFNGPEITMQKDLMHYANTEHRDVHNVYGYFMTMATFAGHKMMRPKRRPFILTRSFFAGSQRYAAVWTGDNAANWDHLQAATPMLLQLSMTGIHFCGADVGGFFGNPDTELLVRWYQAAAYTPFFRGHAHIDTKRREPWLFGEENTNRVRNAIRSRYTVLPYLYTLFHIAHTRGLPIMRPLWMEFPGDEKALDIDDTFMLGPALLVKPVSAPDTLNINVYLPGDANTIWYPFKGEMPAGKTSGGLQGLKGLWSRLTRRSAPAPNQQGLSRKGASEHPAEATIDQGVPVFQLGGTIVPTRERARRSTSSMKADPYTLHVALDMMGKAAGELYMDDGDTEAYEHGAFLKVRLT